METYLALEVFRAAVEFRVHDAAWIAFIPFFYTWDIGYEGHCVVSVGDGYSIVLFCPFFVCVQGAGRHGPALLGRL